uniref:LDB19 N-terminal domain-containing protein n=1 Tax=Bionectria ochroleuca TaxID=29856 RepID=A0A8H7TUL0_BIOOC
MEVLSMFSKVARPCQPRKTLPLDLRISCAPILVDDNAERGPGSFISGQVHIDTRCPDVRITRLDVTMDMITTYKRPVHKSCINCCTDQKALCRWNLVEEPLHHLTKNRDLAFYDLLPSHLPPSISLSMISINYQLRATAFVQHPEHGCYAGSVITIDHSIPLCRVSSKPQLPPYISHTSTSTGLEFRAFLEAIQIHNPSNISIQLDGLLRQSTTDRMNYKWKILRTEWALDEVVTFPSQSCEKHPGLDWLRAAQKPVTKTRNLAAQVMYGGWKSDPADESLAALDLTVDLSTKSAAKLPPTCSYDSPNLGSLKIHHYLTLELSVILEQYSEGKKDEATAVGVGRIIKQRFPVSLVDSIGVDDTVMEFPDYTDPPYYEMVIGD